MEWLAEIDAKRAEEAAASNDPHLKARCTTSTTHHVAAEERAIGPTTRATVINETADWISMSVLAQRARGMVSVRLNAVAPVKDTWR
jgi:predicted acyl esterase